MSDKRASAVFRRAFGDLATNCGISVGGAPAPAVDSGAECAKDSAKNTEGESVKKTDSEKNADKEGKGYPGRPLSIFPELVRAQV